MSAMSHLSPADFAQTNGVFIEAVDRFKSMSPKAALASLAGLVATVEKRASIEPEFFNELLDEVRGDVEECLTAHAAARAKN